MITTRRIMLALLAGLSALVLAPVASSRPVRRISPHDLHAEANVLSAMLLDSDAVDDILGNLAPADFYSDANRLIFEACRELVSQGTPIDIVSVASWLRDREQIGQVGGASYLALLVDTTPDFVQLNAHVRVVKEKRQLRCLIGTWG